MSYILENSIFLHIPKTGGCTAKNIFENMAIVKRTLEIQGNSHPNIELIKKWGYWDAKPFKFSLIRHPLEWLMSFYAWRKGKGKKNLIPYIPCNYTNFNNLVEKCIENKYISNCWNRYISECNFVCKIENLRNDLIVALVLAGERFNPNFILTYPRRNAGINQKPQIDKKLALKLLESENEIVKYFNYNYLKEEWLNG